MNPEGFKLTLLATQCSLLFDKHQTKLSSLHIFTFVSIKTLTKNLIKALKLEQLNIYPRNSADVQSDCREQLVILTSFMSCGSMLLLECKLHYVPMVGYRAFQNIH